MAPTITSQNPLPEEDLLAYRAAGMFGHVVGRATLRGGQLGFDPQAKRKIRVVTDMDTNSAYEIDLAAVTKEDTIAATDNGRMFAEAMTLEGLQDVQMTAFGRLQERAKQRAEGQKAAAVAQTQQTLRAPVAAAAMTFPVPGASTASAPTMPPPGPTWAPEQFVPPTMPAAQLSANAEKDTRFQSSSAGHEVQAVSPVALHQEVKVQAPSLPDREFIVTFEIDSAMGPFEAPYYDILKQDEKLVLVIKKPQNGRGGFRYLPPALDDRVIFVDVHHERHDHIYAVRSLGLNFTFGEFEFCTLLIEQEVPKQPVSPDDQFPDPYAAMNGSDR